MSEIKFTYINHIVREELQLSWIEYGFADLIYHLSNNPDSKVPSWCYASKPQLAEILGVSRREVFNMLDTLEGKHLIERDQETGHVKTTKLWYDKAIAKERVIELPTSAENALPVQKSHSTSANNAPEAVQKMHPIYISDNNKDNNKRESKPQSSLNYLLTTPAEDILEFTTNFKCNDKQVMSKGDDLYHYCKAKGKKYSNYKSFMRNALKRDFGVRPPTSQEDQVEEVSEEQRLAARERISQLKSQFKLKTMDSTP